MTYGIEVQDDADPFVDLIEDANHNFNAATVPGAFLVDFFPSLRNLPEWLPGMGFMETARIWARATADMVEVPYSFTKKNMVRLFRYPSFEYRADFCCWVRMREQPLRHLFRTSSKKNLLCPAPI